MWGKGVVLERVAGCRAGEVSLVVGEASWGVAGVCAAGQDFSSSRWFWGSGSMSCLCWV